MSNVVKKIKTTKIVSRIIFLILALLILSITYNLFLVPNNLVTGGCEGIAIVIYKYFKMDQSLFIFIFSIITLVLSYIYLDKVKASGEVLVVFLFPLLVKLTSNVGKYINTEIDSIFIITVVSAILYGIAIGIILKVNFSNTGISAIALIISERFKLSFSKISFIIQLFIVITGGITFGIGKIMYAIIFIGIENYVVDRVILGISKTKAFYIVTDKENSVKKFILDNLSHGYTEIKAVSAKSGKDKKVLMCVIPTNEYSMLKKGIKKIDSSAFFLITDTYESNGVKMRRILG